MVAAARFSPAFCAGLCALSGAGCTPSIGAACSTSIDCSALGDRYCDVTQPGGYCTQFNCQPDLCPTEAACIVFRSTLDPSCGNSADGRFGRFAQTFCMKLCTKDSNCRDGYQCVHPADRAASLYDLNRSNPGDVQVCMALAAPPTIASATPGVCSPGSAQPLQPYQPPSSTAAAGGASAKASSQSAAAAGGAAGHGGASGAGGK